MNKLQNDLDTIQSFIDDTFINDQVSMTSSVLFQKVSDSLESDFSEKDFLVIFRAALSCCRITGISGVKKIGYKRSDSYDNPLTDDIPLLQKFIDKTFVNDNSMKAKDVFKAVKNDLSVDINEEEFISDFKSFLVCKMLTGIVGVRGKGYCNSKNRTASTNPTNRKTKKIENVQSSEKLSELDSQELRGSVFWISDNLRLAPLDKRNWGLQKQVKFPGGQLSWTSFLYWPTLKDALKGVTRYMMNNKLGKVRFDVQDLGSMSKLIATVEQNIIDEILSSMKKHAASTTPECIGDSESLDVDAA